MNTVGLVAGLAAGLAIASTDPAAAENVLRFSGKDAWAATMDPDSEQALRGFFHTQSEWNLVDCVNPRVGELIEKIDGELVT
jgi:hypothetical protein